jgi:hypothetical protein
MKPIETANNELGGSKRQSHGFQFIKGLDGRKQPIRGLWVRNGRFYARLNLNSSVEFEKPRMDTEGHG